MDKLLNLQRSLNEELKKIICQIVGVTDPIRREQAEEEYKDVNEKLNKCCEQINILQREIEEKKIADEIDKYEKKEQSKIANEYKQTHCLIEALENMNVINLRDEINRKRVRVRNDRCAIMRLANALDKRIIVYNLHGDRIDSIGNGDDQLILYIWTFTREPLYNIFAIENE